LFVRKNNGDGLEIACCFCATRLLLKKIKNNEKKCGEFLTERLLGALLSGRDYWINNRN